MKKSNLLTFFVRAVFACAVLITMAKAAFAQITLDLDVLTEDFPPQKNERPAVVQPEPSLQIPLKEPAPEVKKTAPAEVKKTPAAETKKPTPPTKPKPAAKPVVKKAQPPSKASEKKAVVQPKEKYQVRETAQKDEHDKLKPHAAPVPKVKILAANNGSEETGEELLTEGRKSSETSKEPKLSKHFLEQQRLKEVPKKQLETLAEQQPVVLKEPKQKSVPQLAAEAHHKAKKELPAVKPAPEEKVQETKPAILNFSVFPVSEKLTTEERSALLAKEIPQESATIKALTDKKTLYGILIFDKKSAELTEEMQNALNNVAAVMKKEKGRRLILYSYSTADPAEPGKERQYALRRALMIRSYLTVQGIHSLRIELRSQGSKGAGDKIPDRTDLVFLDK
ncbi:MAG: OmpA family protein [Alphaproteobacteria bacterium]|nr:OmpA family protein [Alphaproteobacteria bacterium]